MRWGKAYKTDYVNILYRSVMRNISGATRFVCLTNDREGLAEGIEVLPLPDMGLSPERLAHGGWQKLCLFAPKLHDIQGRVLFLDIDVIITGSLDIFFESKSPLVIIREWRQLGHYLTGRKNLAGNSSVFAFDIGGQVQIYDSFMRDQEKAFAAFRNEQRFLCHHVRGLAYWEEDLCLSFKSNLMFYPPLNFVLAPRALPPDARVVAFHGKPLPEEVIHEGWWGKGLRRGYGAVGWAKENWH
jgi:hypothetical protein